MSAAQVCIASDTDAGIATFFRSASWEISPSRRFPESQHVNLQELTEIADEMRHVDGTDAIIELARRAEAAAAA